ncbi:MAG TPA: ATP-binding protein [Candidatus Omnitrophota bacterium]|nr:ATP-binding protein [Candidatus Omnitrophota bacterium]
MNLVLDYNEGTDHLALLRRIDFCNVTGPLFVDMDRVPFFHPSTLTLLYGIFKLHYCTTPGEKRTCQPASFQSSETDVNRYVQRVNFFDSCPDLKPLREEKFRRHDPAGRFVPITEVHKMEETDSVAQRIVSVIFSKSKVSGETQVKYALSELMDNALQHAESPIGCVVQAQLYRTNSVEGVILDCGMGVRKHLQGNRTIVSELTSDEKALQKALEPHVSGTHNRKRDPEKREGGYHNAGLGLPVCCELMKRSGGFLQLISGKSCLTVDREGCRHTAIAGWPGTFITFRINYQNIANITDIIKEFDIRKTKGHNLEKGEAPKFI